MLTSGAPESGDMSKMSVLEGGITSPPCPSGGTELTVVLQGPEMEVNNMKQLLNEFKGLYEQRLRCLDLNMSDMSTEELLQKRADVLRSYVGDLTDQNQVLVQTIEVLQREAGHTVTDVEMKVSEVDPGTLLLDTFIGPVVDNPHSTGSLAQFSSESEHLKIQLQTKDVVISDLKRELAENLEQKQKTATQVLESGERLVHLKSELSCLNRIHEDSMKEIDEKDICITELTANIQLLQQEGADTHAQLSKLNVRTKELQEELKRKEEERRQSEEEQKMREETEQRKAEVRKRQEQQKKEEWLKRMEEEKRRDEEWKKEIEEDRKACTQAVKKWAEKATILNSELEVSRKQVEQQSRKLSDFQQKEETLLFESEAKMLRLKDELSTFFEKRMKEKEVRINQLTKELNEVTRKVKTEQSS
ncbi:putative autophagy-related protein 11 [Brachyistius frenatus]|uniref:putative autophagy-related protein 11 n=1 Tax=Brachyistius frenatus TaxID=100188 RepID=UPI0037E83234